MVVEEIAEEEEEEEEDVVMTDTAPDVTRVATGVAEMMTGDVTIVTVDVPTVLLAGGTGVLSPRERMTGRGREAPSERGIQKIGDRMKDPLGVGEY